jgi:hypothetical protein
MKAIHAVLVVLPVSEAAVLKCFQARMPYGFGPLLNTPASRDLQ